MTEYGLLNDEGKVILKPDTLKWAKAFEKQNCRVAETFVKTYRISTIFLGINHCFGRGLPLWFETMVFNYPQETLADWSKLHCERTGTRAEALEAHTRAVKQFLER